MELVTLPPQGFDPLFSRLMDSKSLLHCLSEMQIGIQGWVQVWVAPGQRVPRAPFPLSAYY